MVAHLPSKRFRQRLVATCLGLLGGSAAGAWAQAPLPIPPPAAEVRAAGDAAAPALTGVQPTAAPAPAPSPPRWQGNVPVAAQPPERLPAPPEVKPPTETLPAPAPAPIQGQVEELPAVPAVPAPAGGCATCGGGGMLSFLGGAPGCATCGTCRHPGCYAGQPHCYPCDASTPWGRLWCGFYCCVCCPDPCYEPRWVPEANAAFFVDPVRPMTQTRLRWDSGLNYLFPDRAEFFWARADGNGRGPALPEQRTNYDSLALYTEVAPTPKFSLFFEVPYVAVDPIINPQAANFGDMNLGTKSIFLDCELLMMGFQFRTYLPTGNANKGLGTGHVSLEPSLLCSLKLASQTYLQSQIAEWIPIGGDQTYQGSVLHYHFSLNHVLFRVLPDSPLIGTMEFNGFSFQDGNFTDPFLGPFQSASGSSYLSLGPGLRMSICNRVDFGVGAAFALRHLGPLQVYRSELRIRF